MTTLVEDVRKAINNLGGQATLRQIYGEVELIKDSPLPKSWQANVRQAIETHSSDSHVFQGKDYFRKIRKGIWALRDQEGIIKSLPTKHKNVEKKPKGILIPESFETVANYLRTIKEYREYSNPASSAWIEYLQEFFHIIGFSTEKQESRLFFLKNMGGNTTSKAIVVIVLPGEDFEEIIPGLKWETYLLFAANYYQTEWGILFNGLQLKVINYGGGKKQPAHFWPDLDGIIEYEKLDSFFTIYKVFSFIKDHVKELDRSHDTRRQTKVIPHKTEPNLKSLNWNTDTNIVHQFVESVLKKQFGDGFKKVGRSYIYESGSEIVYFQNSNVEKDQWWYRVLKNARQYLASSKKQTWLCLTNIPRKIVYIIPMKAVEEQARYSGWTRDELEITIYPLRSWWHQLKWNIQEYQIDFK